MIDPPALLLVATLIGLCLGSYATTAGLRFCRSDQYVFGRSRCDHCQAPLSYAQTLPIISYARAAGACGHCGGRIDPLHIVGEGLGGSVVLAAFVLTPPLQAVLISALGLVLLASSVVDLRSRRLPDGLTLAVALLALSLDAATSLAALGDGLLCACVTFALLEAVRRGFLRLRGRHGLGFGDVKLAAALALWLGAATPWAVLGAAVTGLVAIKCLRPTDGRLAFGPALAGAGWLVGLMREAHAWPSLI